jgi:hypothetical protein
MALAERRRAHRACWADHRNVPQIAFKPTGKRHTKAAPFKRNDQMLEALPIGVIVLPGSGISAILADKPRKLGIPVWTSARVAHERHRYHIQLSGTIIFGRSAFVFKPVFQFVRRWKCWTTGAPHNSGGRNRSGVGNRTPLKTSRAARGRDSLAAEDLRVIRCGVSRDCLILTSV